MLEQFKGWLVQQPTIVRLILIFQLQIILCACCFFPFRLLDRQEAAAPSQTDIQIAALLYLTEVSLSATAVETDAPPTATGTPTSTSSPIPTDTPVPPPTLLPTNTPQPIVPSGLAICISPDAQREVATLLQVVDGDTISVRISGQNYNVRYIGMDTPETGQTGGYAATQRNYQLVFGKELLLVKDTSEVDRFGRLLRYVIADGVFVNEQLVLEGLAIAKDYPPDSACRTQLSQAQTQAQNNQVGQWAAAPPVVLPIPIAPGGGGGESGGGGDGNCDPAYPTVCIPPFPPDLNCPDISHKRFTVLAPDPHGFDRDGDGIGCE